MRLQINDTNQLGGALAAPGSASGQIDRIGQQGFFFIDRNNGAEIREGGQDFNKRIWFGGRTRDRCGDGDGKSGGGKEVGVWCQFGVCRGRRRTHFHLLNFLKEILKLGGCVCKRQRDRDGKFCVCISVSKKTWKQWQWVLAGIDVNLHSRKQPKIIWWKTGNNLQ